MTGNYVRICRLDELADGGIKKTVIDDKPIVVANYQGTIYAIDDICTHDGGDLGRGDIIDGQIQCPRHGARFDLKTGEATRMPAVIPVDTYEVKIENGEIYVSGSK